VEYRGREAVFGLEAENKIFLKKIKVKCKRSESQLCLIIHINNVKKLKKLTLSITTHPKFSNPNLVLDQKITFKFCKDEK